MEKVEIFKRLTFQKNFINSFKTNFPTFNWIGFHSILVLKIAFVFLFQQYFHTFLSRSLSDDKDISIFASCETSIIVSKTSKSLSFPNLWMNKECRILDKMYTVQTRTTVDIVRSFERLYLKKNTIRSTFYLFRNMYDIIHWFINLMKLIDWLLYIIHIFLFFFFSIDKCAG